MEQVVTALWGLAAAVIMAVGGVLVPVIRDYATNLLQARIGAAAGRVAGEIAARVAADPTVTAATQAMIAAGAEALKARVPDAIRKLGASDDTLRGMVAGEVGKLLAPMMPVDVLVPHSVAEARG